MFEVWLFVAVTFVIPLLVVTVVYAMTTRASKRIEKVILCRWILATLSVLVWPVALPIAILVGLYLGLRTLYSMITYEPASQYPQDSVKSRKETIRTNVKELLGLDSRTIRR